MKEYKEIFKLKEMLEEANIPFEFEDNSGRSVHFRLYHIGYPVLPPVGCVCSVVEGNGTYGGKIDKLEIMGLLTEEEKEYDSVKGCLTAEDVFGRIKKHYEEVEE